MFGSNKKQYVAIIQQNKQLKLHYKTIQNEKMLKEEHSTFLITNQTMPQDALLKLETLQNDNPFTYLATLFEGKNQQIIKNEEIDVLNYDSVKLDDSLHIAIPKNELAILNRYFEHSGIDYIFSPFTILYQYIQQYGVKNSLNVFILNNTIYTIVLGAYKEFVRADVKEITPFDEIKDEEFSDDDIVNQKLYEEVHFLEVQQFLNDIVQEYYSSKDDSDFLEEIKLTYTLQPFTKEQLDSLYEELMIPVKHEQIELSKYLFDLMTDENISEISFIKPRVKKEKTAMSLWLFLAILSMLLIGGAVYFGIKSKEKQKMTHAKKAKPVHLKKEVTPKKEVVSSKKVVSIELPDHRTNNNTIKENLLTHFEIIPYDAVLKDIELAQDKSTIVVNFAMPNSSLEDMQLQLKNIYKDSKILLKEQKKAILKSVIENKNLITKKETKGIKIYPKSQFIPVNKVLKYIQSLVIPNSSVKLLSSTNKLYQVDSFKIVSKVANPQEFIQFIEQLNKRKRALLLEYPIKFSKLNNAIEVEYNLSLYQKKATK